MMNDLKRDGDEITERLEKLVRRKNQGGWYVVKGDARKNPSPEIGHYCAGLLRRSICRGRSLLDGRRWDVVRDVGVIRLCEACKSELRLLDEPKTK